MPQHILKRVAAYLQSKYRQAKYVIFSPKPKLRYWRWCCAKDGNLAVVVVQFSSNYTTAWKMALCQRCIDDFWATQRGAVALGSQHVTFRSPLQAHLLSAPWHKGHGRCPATSLLVAPWWIRYCRRIGGMNVETKN